MSLPVTVSIANPASGACPTTFQAAVNLLKTLITAVVTGNYIPYVTGANTPNVDDQDKVWQRVDSGGRPLGTYVFYNGHWRPQYTGKTGEVTMYNGIPSVDFDGTGLGIVGGRWDGWGLCNGINGRLNLTDRFIVAAKLDDLSIGYTTGWQSTIEGPAQFQGGVTQITLDDLTTFRPARDGVDVGHWHADGNAAAIGGGLFGQTGGAGGTSTLLAADSGNTSPDPITIIPKFFVLAFAQFVGY